VGQAHHLFRIQAMLKRPSVPHPGNRGSRIDEDAIQVEQNCLAGDLSHLF